MEHLPVCIDYRGRLDPASLTLDWNAMSPADRWIVSATQRDDRRGRSAC
jgi:hypothetical protein